MQEMSAQVKEFTEQANRAKHELDALLSQLPNLPDPSAAPGPEDELVRQVGTVRELDFPPRDHLELAGAMIDMDRGARLSGARFAYLKGDLVMVELALVRWVLEKLRGAGFEPVVPPVLVRERALYGTGFLPDTEQQIYSLPQDELFLAGTSEVALASLHEDEILDRELLPLRYAGFSPCFRREAGAAGKDTRGIFRVHQFDKVEMFSFVTPEESAQEHERILAIEEEILGELELPYRVLNIAVGDLGNSAAKKYDCEAWIPSQGRYRELTSCSNTTDYQARRLNIRVRGDGRTRVLHTLNGTAVAVGRTIVALLENGQRADGSVELPQRAGRVRRAGDAGAGAAELSRGHAASAATRRLDSKKIGSPTIVKGSWRSCRKFKERWFWRRWPRRWRSAPPAAPSPSVAEVIARSGVSSRAFHEEFPDREACLLAALELGVERARKPVLGAYDAELRWLDAVKAGLVAFLRFLEYEQALGRLLVVYSLSGGELVLRRRVELLAVVAAAVDRGRLEAPAGRQQPPEVIAEGVVGAVLAILQNRLLADGDVAVMDLFGALVSIIVLPYLGVGVARRELLRPPPRIRGAAAIEPPEAGASGERAGGARITYRTARVLSSIAAYPGASNREVADRAGIVDQGQISKLLNRLQARGLIAKLSEGRARGAPNSWRLTERGELVLRERRREQLAELEHERQRGPVQRREREPVVAGNQHAASAQALAVGAAHARRACTRGAASSARVRAPGRAWRG